MMKILDYGVSGMALVYDRSHQEDDNERKDHHVRFH